MDIHTALTLIEQYVESLQSWELKDEYDKAASSMFAWLRDYGCSHSDLGLACSIIQEATGYHPSHIRTLDDASVVKEAIYSAMKNVWVNACAPLRKRKGFGGRSQTFDLDFQEEGKMTRSMTVLTTQTVKIADRDEFLSLVAFARKFDDTAGGFEPFLSDAAIDYPDLNSIVATAIEQGMAFWGIPEFEQCAYQNLCWWAGEGDLVRVKFFAQWLLTTGPDIASRQWLEDFAIGNFWDYLDDRELRCPVLGKTEEYLYPFNFCRLVEAQRRCDERRTWLDLNGDRLAYEKYGWVDVENL